MNTAIKLEAQPEKIYLSCADTAKELRKALKKAFPSTKFSIRSKTYAGGASIDIHYTDSISSDEVEKVTKHFEGATFDGMIDLKEYVTTEHEGKLVHWGADYIFVHRDHSDEALLSAINNVYNKYKNRFEELNIMKPTIGLYYDGSCQGIYLFERFGDSLAMYIRKELSKTNFN